MEDALLAQLENLTIRKEGQATEIPLGMVQRIADIAQRYQARGLHWQGIELLHRARQIIAPLPDLDAVLANCIGGSVELILKWADQLGVPPPQNLLSTLEADLNQALALDPSNPNLHWDLAVIKARFMGNYRAAEKALEDAITLGYQHPMLPRLQALIQAAPQVSTALPDSLTQLRQLLLRIAVQATGPDAWKLDNPQLSADQSTIEDYLHQAISILETEEILNEDYHSLMRACQQIFAGDAAEAVADLLRRIAEISGSDVFLNRATAWHIQLIIQSAFQLFPEDRQNQAAIRRSLRAANRGLSIVDDSDADIEPDWQAELLIARGQALYYQEPPQPAEAIRCYHQALVLKRQAGNDADAKRLEELLRSQIEHRVGRGIISTLIGGIGEALEVLQACIVAAEALGDPTFALQVKMHLASIRRQAGQFTEAEETLNGILDASPAEELAREAQFELASVYSETNRPLEAASLQKLLLDSGSAADPMLWANYANSLMLLHDLDGALAALEHAWELLPPDQKAKTNRVLPTQGAHNRMLAAQVLLKKGLPGEALKAIELACALNEHPHGIEALHFYRIQASVYLAMESYEDALNSLEKALHQMASILGHGPSIHSWESMLSQWADLDAGMIHALLHSQLPDSAEKALLRAESAKGRLYAWFESHLAPQGAASALSLDRQSQALELARQWLAQKEKRQLISLFASSRGLGVFHLEGSENIAAAWLEEVHYDEFIQDIFEPWEKLSEQETSPDFEPEFLALANSQTNYLLDLVGTWLWRAQPLLGQGGSDLVIIPHRAFRSIPLAHARLPDGNRLSDLFETVTVLPALGDLVREAASAGSTHTTAVHALADADGSLAFARCEALLAGTGHQLAVGQDVTAQALREALGREGLTLLSLHGDFDETNPYRSRIFVYDGEVELHSLMIHQTAIRNQVVILGVCEAGRSRRSVSDEPFGFPAIFFQGGARVVLAPAWRVDDFVSFLFMTMLFEELSRGTTIYHAFILASRWLRSLNAQQALERMETLTQAVRQAALQADVQIDEFEYLLSEQKAWLEKQPPLARAFRYPLDWSAFQLTGALPDSSSVLPERG